MDAGTKYHWINQPERLVYMGYNWSSNGYWHQFAKVESPYTIWCEVLPSDLKGLIETPEESEVDQLNDTILELQCKVDVLSKQRAFFRSCMLSGEIAKDSDEPMHEDTDNECTVKN